MLDTSGIGDSLPLTTLALDTALLQFGLFDSALAKIGFYFDTFVYQNGTIDMGHWKDIWKDRGDGQYNCTYPDGLTDMGRILELFADTVRLSRNTSWLADHIDPAMRVGQYLLSARREAVAAFPSTDPRHGLVYGPAEHDTCDMGMGASAKVVDDQYMLYYFSVSMQHWRGMVSTVPKQSASCCDYIPFLTGWLSQVELGSLMTDFPGVSCRTNATLAAELLAEAVRFKDDIDAALERSVVRNASGHVVFIPAAATPGAGNATPYTTMTMDTVASCKSTSNLPLPVSHASVC